MIRDSTTTENKVIALLCPWIGSKREAYGFFFFPCCHHKAPTTQSSFRGKTNPDFLSFAAVCSHKSMTNYSRVRNQKVNDDEAWLLLQDDPGKKVIFSLDLPGCKQVERKQS